MNMESYQNKDFLYQKYVLEEKSLRQIANRCECDNKTILNWLKKFNIPRRTLNEAQKGEKHPNFGKHLSEKTRIKISKSLKGENSYRWKGGQFLDSLGYVRILMPEHPRANAKGYIKRSYLIAEKKLGRPLRKEEITHHKNGIRDDDRPENIEIFSSQAKHMSFHRQKKEINR